MSLSLCCMEKGEEKVLPESDNCNNRDASKLICNYFYIFCIDTII